MNKKDIFVSRTSSGVLVRVGSQALELPASVFRSGLHLSGASIYESGENGKVLITLPSERIARKTLDEICLAYSHASPESAFIAREIPRRSLMGSVLRTARNMALVIAAAFTLIILWPEGSTPDLKKYSGVQPPSAGETDSRAPQNVPIPRAEDSAPLAALIQGANEVARFAPDPAHSGTAGEAYVFRPNVSMPEVKMPDLSCDFD